MANITRTVNPLHFEDLEPHRFEDLVRQLAYDFRPWRKLEATGRAGSDDGFDARGWEIVSDTDINETDSESFVEEESIAISDRQWLIQCKREKEIGPKKLKDYLNSIPKRERDNLYGIVMVVACNLSKKARDEFHIECTSLGFNESYLWSKAELEDMLFLPKNDHLLFAYFGFSITIRNRSIRTELRARLAMKRKVYRVLKDKQYEFLLIRDPEAPYPYIDEVPNFDTLPPWISYKFHSFIHSGISFHLRQSFAYIADDKKSWDVAFIHNDAEPSSYDYPWAKSRAEWEPLRVKVYQDWKGLSDMNRATFDVYGVISGSVALNEIIDTFV